MADFNEEGNLPDDKARFTITFITGRSCGRMLTRRPVGIGSRLQDALEDFWTISSISLSEEGTKDDKIAAHGSRTVSKENERSDVEFSSAQRFVRIVAILLMKKALP